MQHRGRAVVFEHIDDYKAKINDELLSLNIKTEIDLTPEVVKTLKQENLI